MNLAQVTPEFWRDRRVLLTGHTGFKGSWLAVRLRELGASVWGLALAPKAGPDLFSDLEIAEDLHHRIVDIRDPVAVEKTVAEARPQLVLHLAAQALVRASYEEPLETYATNVIGTANLLQALRNCPDVQVVINVTTDKVYDNREYSRGYREYDPLGGADPYSSSKACSELVTHAYRRSFLADAGIAVATARAGNVLGGGDWSVDRIVPDAIRAFMGGQPLVVRNPASTRPWQHVVEPLEGYLMLAEACRRDPARFAQGWNFGPAPADAAPVREVADRLVKYWGAPASWEQEERAEPHPHEESLLQLDIGKVTSQLGWTPRLSLDTTLQWTVEWYRAYAAGERGLKLRRRMVRQFESYAEENRPV